MQAEIFHVGLVRDAVEISGRGYRRQRLVLTHRAATDDFANDIEVAFPAARWPYGFIDGLALATSPDGPVIAVTKLLLPISIGIGQAFASPPGCIVMSRASLAAIRAIRPINLGHTKGP